MKKTITLALSTSFLLGFAASVLAADGDVLAKEGTKVTLDGNIRMRGRMFKDTVKDGHAATSYDGRVQLGTGVVMSPKISGYIQLETGDGSSDVYTWGNGTSSGLNTGGSKQSASTSVNCADVDGDDKITAADKNVNGTCQQVQSVSSTDATDLSLAQAWINFKITDMIGTKVGHVPLALGNKTFFDHSPSGDDTIIFYADPTPETHVGLLTIKFEEGSAGTNKDDINGYVALLSQKLGGDMKLGANITNLRNTAGEMDAYNLGVDFAGKFGPASVNVDLQYQLGDWATNYSASGWCFRAEAGMAAGPANVGVILGYGTGDDTSTANDGEGFVNFLADVKYETLIVGYAAAVPGQTIDSRLSNMLLIQANGAMKLNDDISVSATLTYMSLNETDKWSNGVEKESDIGLELDAFMTYKLGNGLSYGIEFGYLMAGDAWQAAYNGDVEDSYYLRHTLNLNF